MFKFPQRILSLGLRINKVLSAMAKTGCKAKKGQYKITIKIEAFFKEKFAENLRRELKDIL